MSMSDPIADMLTRIRNGNIAKGIPNNLSKSLASSSVFAVVTKTISIPLILST